MTPAREPDAPGPVLVVGPALAGVTAVAGALGIRLTGHRVTEDLDRGQRPSAVVFVVSAAAPMTGSAAALLEVAAAGTDLVVGALTKIDIHQDWPDVLAANRAALAGSRFGGAPWIGVAAAPEIGPPRIDGLVDALRTGLAQSDLTARNRLRRRESELVGLIADAERATLVRRRSAAERAAARRGVLVRVRLELLGQSRAMCAGLRTELRARLAHETRLSDFTGYVGRRVAEVTADLDRALTRQLADVCGDVAPEHRLPPVETGAPPPALGPEENRLTALLGAGFGLGAALALGRVSADLLNWSAQAATAGAAPAGMLLGFWVVRTRRLLAERATLDRWIVEVTAALRAATQDQVVAAVAAVDAGGSPTRPASSPSPPAAARLSVLVSELDAVRAELSGAGAPVSGRVCD